MLTLLTYKGIIKWVQVDLNQNLLINVLTESEEIRGFSLFPDISSRHGTNYQAKLTQLHTYNIYVQSTGGMTGRQYQ